MLYNDNEYDTCVYNINQNSEISRAEKVKKLINLKNLNEEEKLHVEKLIISSSDIFILSNEALTTAKCDPIEILLSDNKTCFCQTM